MILPSIFFLLLLLVYLFGFDTVKTAAAYDDLSPEDFLSLGDSALGADAYSRAINYYKQGLEALDLDDDDDEDEKDGDDDDDDQLLTFLSLNTNLATAYSSLGQNDDAISHYKSAVDAYQSSVSKSKTQQQVMGGDENNNSARNISSQASFYLGMVLQDEDKPRQAVEAYGYAVVLDPFNWAALANLGSVLHDQLSNHDEAVQAYNKAYEILTEHFDEVTDPPAEPRFILSQLQYRIGLCLNHDVTRKCAVVASPLEGVANDGDNNNSNKNNNVATEKATRQHQEVSCKEMATHAFSLAVQYDPDNESAKHMLATITADATMKRASNTYVKNLFDDYATNFEHSLVEELKYDGYERLRRGFDRAFGGQEYVPTFPLVVDAGCGTGLVGQQFRNISKTLIGVDLSEAILDEAEKLRPKLYDERIAGDVTEVFRQKKPISLIVAADSYIYFGDLIPLFASMQYGLEDGGYVAFTLENVNEEDEIALNDSKPDWRWQLTPSGRFAHRKEYALSVGRSHGFTLKYYESLDGFRYELGRSVRGHMFLMQLSTQQNDEL